MLNDEDKREIERILDERATKAKLWWLDKIPFVAGGFAIGLWVSIMVSNCSHFAK